jgi:hypothetical protein
MKEPKAYDKYPISSVIIFNLVALINYGVGLYLFSQVNAILMWLYLIYLIVVEITVYREGCVSCCYYGKRCFSGRGVIAPKLFKKQDPKRFCEKEVTWKNLLPTMMTTVLPILAGGFLLIQNFSWFVVGMIAIPILTWIVGNPIIYGKLGCPHCKQGRICCPANDFFGKKVEKKGKKK